MQAVAQPHQLISMWSLLHLKLPCSLLLLTQAVIYHYSYFTPNVWDIKVYRCIRLEGGDLRITKKFSNPLERFDTMIIRKWKTSCWRLDIAGLNPIPFGGSGCPALEAFNISICSNVLVSMQWHAACRSGGVKASEECGWRYHLASLACSPKLFNMASSITMLKTSMPCLQLGYQRRPAPYQRACSTMLGLVHSY